MLDKVQTQAHTYTCGVGQNYIVVTHSGKVSQCHTYLNQPVTDTLDAKTVLPLLAQGTIHNLSVAEKEECRECSYRYRCTGGCPLETYRATGRWNGKNPNCNIYKALYPEALHLEGLRLLAVHGII